MRIVSRKGWAEGEVGGLEGQVRGLVIVTGSHVGKKLVARCPVQHQMKMGKRP